MRRPSLRLPFRIVAVLLLTVGGLTLGAIAPTVFAQDATVPPEARPFEVDGVRLMVPAGWLSEPTLRVEAGIRTVALSETDAASPYPGVRLTVEVLPGLNRLQQERWLRGQLLRGLDKSYTIEPVAPSLLGGTTGAAVAFARRARAGYALYTRGGLFYTVRIDAPQALWDDAEIRAVLLNLVRSVRVTA